MGELGTLLSFYPNRKDASSAHRYLRRRGFRRSALIHKSSAGDIKLGDRSPWYGLFWGVTIGLFSGWILLSALRLFGPEGLVAVRASYHVLGLSAFAGSLAGWFFIRSFGLGIDRELILKHTSWLVSEETVIIVLAPLRSMGRAIELLRRPGKTQPSIFAFHPERAREATVKEAVWIKGEPLSAENLRQHAARLAGSHPSNIVPGRGEPLLREIDKCERVIEDVRQALAEASHMEQNISVPAEWILDNSFIIQGQIDSIRKNLPANFYNELPVIVSGQQKGQPRIYSLANELLLHTDGQLERHITNDFLEGYQSVQALTIGELWALPIMLGIVIIENLRRLVEQVDRQLREGESADFWANRLIVFARREPDNLFAALTELSREQPDPSVNFAFQLTGHLYDEDAALIPVQGWLQRKFGGPLGGIFVEERARQSADEVSVANYITSLRHLRQIDWRELFESHSRVDSVLRRDPAYVYSAMDFSTRNSYRNAVEELSRWSGVSEEQVAEKAVEMAKEAESLTDSDRINHVGFYLTGKGRAWLSNSLGCRESLTYRLVNWVSRNHAFTYLGAVGLAMASILTAMIGTGIYADISTAAVAAIAFFSIVPASQAALQFINYIVTRTMPPRILPKMSFEASGIPDRYRTLVVVPVLIPNTKTVKEEIEKLEVRYQANPDPNLVFSLFADYVDADEKHREDDLKLLEVAVAGIERLNSQYGLHKFFLFHRERVWTESESRYMGWERKRGKLEELNRLLTGDGPKGQSIVKVGDPEALEGIRFVITLDSDTQLPRDSARRMVETMAHPLNFPRISKDGSIVESGFTIIQPRVSTSLTSATATWFSRTFTDFVGTDPYTSTVSDVYMDLTGEGSYHGKGIYDPHVFHKVLSGRFPEQRLLSHDLIEGVHVRVGFASDIELFDDYPPDYLTYSSRQHRWICGDWQIAEWFLPRVSTPEGVRVPNPLSGLNRWKIFDNLRRSTVPAMSVVMLVSAWLASPAVGAVASILVAMAFFPQLFALATSWLTAGVSLKKSVFGDLKRSLRRSGLEIALIPHQALLSTFAIVRALYRRIVSKKKLLEWTTAQMVQRKASGRTQPYFFQFVSIGVISAGLGALLFAYSSWSLASAVPFILLWISSPFLAGRFLYRGGSAKAPQVVSERDQKMLRRIARQTWRIFDDLVSGENNWMPPDNYQVSHLDEIAPRTSPTNIGLWMLSALAAYDFGYLNGENAIKRVAHTFTTLGRMERYEGHLLNWYDLETLEPLRPRYVSTVDSGNLLGSLWTLQEGLREIINEPILDLRAVEGLLDSVHILGISLKKAGAHRHLKTTEELDRILSGCPDDLGEIIRRIRKAAPVAESLSGEVNQEPGYGSSAEDPGGSETIVDEEIEGHEESVYWSNQINAEIQALLKLIERYLSWAEELFDIPAEVVELLGDDTIPSWEETLRTAPSYRDLARDRVKAFNLLKEASSKSTNLPDPLAAWIGHLRERFTPAVWLAWEVLNDADEIIQQARELAGGMNMKFLYNRDRRLFHVGFNVTDQSLDNSFYDMLASEARLTSFIAVARGDVPSKHWMSLGRPFGVSSGHQVLLSWSGTMFEYLMPFLMQRVFENTLLDRACNEAVSLQIEYGREKKVPWGISESAYGDLDAGKTYQYKAFGVPGLGLKRGLEDDLVITPYATMLSLAVRPAEAIGNLRKLVDAGLYGKYGFYESIDYSRKRDREGKGGVIVRTYMAHHQAMSLLAIDNFLNDQPMQRRFHSDARVRATEPLLFERVPASPPLYIVPTRERAPSSAMPVEIAQSSAKFNTPHSPRPRILLLSNGSYSLMITSAGGGYSRWRDVNVTSWRSDPTRDNRGAFCYIRDQDSDHIWSIAYHPTGSTPDNYVASFTLDRAEIRRSDRGIETESVIIVSAEDDVEIREITLKNRSGKTRYLELTSYMELALAGHDAERTHPAFSKMFLHTEALADSRVLLAHRRLRSEDEHQIWAGHAIVSEGEDEGPFMFETDRKRFLSRGCTPMDPAAIHGKLTGSAGFVLDPIFSIRRQATLRPGQEIRFSMVLGAAESREEIVDLMERYSHYSMIRRSCDLAWPASQLELRQLRIKPEVAHRFQHLASYLLFPSAKHRPPQDRLRQNRLGQSSLWGYGISGDLPIIVLSISDPADIGLVREILLAHSFWRRHGLKTDLLILNEESSSYEQPLNDQLLRLIQGHTMYTGIEEPGGVYLRSIDQIDRDDLTLMLSVAHVTLIAARGPLSQQMSAPLEPPSLPWKKQADVHNDHKGHRALTPIETIYNNHFGGFSTDGREYVITLESGEWTPAPWVNVIANPLFGTIVSESGFGSVWCGNSQLNRLTGWSNDPVSDPPGEVIYLRDEESGRFWTPTPLPIRGDGTYRVRHGAGYTMHEYNGHGIEHELVTFVPVDDNGDEPICIKRIRLSNSSGRKRVISVTYYVEWCLGQDREKTQMHIETSWQSKTQMMLARNRYHPEYGDSVAFAAVRPVPESCTGDRGEFIGRNGSLENPEALRRVSLSGRTGIGLDPATAIQVIVELAPGQSTDVTCLIGQTGTVQEAQDLVMKYSHNLTVEKSFQETARWWDDLLGSVQVRTPDQSVDMLLNRWLPYQTLSCRIWGRSAFYQSSGAFGYRDQLQDVLAMMHLNPALAREHIRYAASRQFRKGDVQHWWHPPKGSGIRSRCSDDLLWLPYATAQYVRFTGDTGILGERVPFIQDRVLDEHENEAFMTPTESVERATIYEHCRRAIERSLNYGEHGLPLIGTGDWNDGMDKVGALGKGESVWLAWFLIDILNSFSEMAELKGEIRAEDVELFRSEAHKLAEAVETSAWDGKWYTRAYDDDGIPIGSAQSKEARLDSISQSWAVISGASDNQRAIQAMTSVWNNLVLEDERLVLLLDPPFDRTERDPGYIKSYPPGIRENGGQYSHAAMWVAKAMALLGDGDRAVKILNILNPVQRTLNREDVLKYVIEPYVLAADVYHAAEHTGRGGWSWYTGAAGWMYRVWIEDVLGIKVHGRELIIDPVIPAEWKEFEVTYRVDRSLYEISVQNPEGVNRGVVWIEVDDRRLEENVIQIHRFGEKTEHRVLVRMGNTA
ncbi:MAG: GH36-type glycosyl hydrolase domain-containing protein [bacterium]